MQALVFGDSQTQGIGKALEPLLAAKGMTVKAIRHSGKSTAKLLTIAKASINPSQYDVIYLFAGGNDPSVNTGPVMDMLAYLQGAKRVVWIGPPPATEIGNLSLARKVFGSKVKHAKYWITSGTAATREAKNAAFKDAVTPTYATYYDVRDAFAQFPPQADGIHVKGDTAAQIAHNLVNLPAPGVSLWVWAVAAAVVVYFARQKKRS